MLFAIIISRFDNCFLNAAFVAFYFSGYYFTFQLIKREATKYNRRNDIEPLWGRKDILHAILFSLFSWPMLWGLGEMFQRWELEDNNKNQRENH